MQDTALPAVPVKLVIIIRKDLKMSRGKEIAQGAHAAMAWLTARIRASVGAEARARGTSTGFVVLSEPELAWVSDLFTKVTLQVDSEEELVDLHKRALDAGIESHLITDAGLTVFREPTITALGIGPDYADKIDEITGDLRLY